MATSDNSSNTSTLTLTERKRRTMINTSSGRRTIPPSTNPWIIALKKTRQQFPNFNLKEAMKYTKTIYIRPARIVKIPTKPLPLSTAAEAIAIQQVVGVVAQIRTSEPIIDPQSPRPAEQAQPEPQEK